MNRASLLLVLSLFALPATAQTWTGGGPDNNWSTGANWAGGVAPASSSATQVAFPFGPPRLSPVVDAPWTINRLTLTPGYNLSGQAVTFSGASALMMALLAGQPIVIANPIALTGGLQIFNTSIVDLRGGISGTGPVSIAGGPGFTTIAGNSTFTGGLVVVGGHALRFEGSMPGPVTISSTSRLTGGGAIAGALTVDASSTLNANVSVGTLRTGNLAASGGIDFSISGSAQGTQYSHFDVTGTVTLGATLTLFGSFVPPAGTVFTIITNDGTDPVVGTFAGLPEGATVTFNGVPLAISYVGGTGNDITLTALGAPAGGFTPVPTLSEWALIALALLVLAKGTGGLRRRG